MNQEDFNRPLLLESQNKPVLNSSQLKNKDLFSRIKQLKNIRQNI